MLPYLCLVAAICASPSRPAAAPSYHVIKRIPAGGEGGWDYLTIDSAAHRLYISRGTHVMVLDSETGASAGDIANTPGVHGIAIARDLGRGFTSNGGDNSVTIFDLKTLKELDRVTVGTGPDAILYDPATHRVFTFNGRSGDATAVDAASGTVAGTVPLDGRPEFAAADGRGMVYANIEDKSEVAAIDAQALTVKRCWSLSPGEGPSGLAIDARRNRLFSVCGNGMMVVSDAEAGKVIATPAIGRGPDAAAFDPREGLAFSSNGEGTLTVVKEQTPETFAVVQNVQTEPGARTMALDPRTHRVYLVTAKALPLPPNATGRERFRRSYEPGSFVVLIVGP